MQTKYPILLVHGIILKDSRIFRSFGKISKRLRDEGYTVYVGRHDGFGTIENNASQLKIQIEEILKQENTDKINIIAHSKGGLDSKYLICELGMQDKVASLTTLCTPHLGSPVATNIMKLPDFILKFVAFWVNFWYKIFGDKKPDSYNVCKELQQHNNITEFPFADKIYCQSFSTKMDKVKDDFIMGIPLIFSRFVEKSETDGLVPINSTKFENYRGNCIEGSASHSQIVDFFTPKKKKEQIYSFYLTLCKELADMNF